MGNRFLTRALFYFAVSLLLRESTAAQVSPREGMQGASMGVQVYIYLFDTREYQDSILPAYRSFKKRSDRVPLLKLVRTAVSRIESSPSRGESPESVEVYQHYVDVLGGKRHYRTEKGASDDQVRSTTAQDMQVFVENSVAPALVHVFCLPRDLGVQPEQSMSGPALMNYLYSQSRWIEDYFTFAKEPSGPVPEITIGDWSRFFSREEVLAFDDQLSKMQRPNGDAAFANDFDNLRALVRAAANNPDFTILLAGL